jgi:hypothetical protein
MKNKPYSLFTLSVLLAALIPTACGPTDPSLAQGEGEAFEYSSYSLSSDEGGFDSADDLADFVNDETQESFEETNETEIAADDSSLNPTPDSTPTPLVKRYYIRVAWGHLYPNPEASVPTNFSGEISSNVATIKVLRTLRFENHDGLLPRTSPKSVTFNSHTLPHNDGLLLTILAPESTTSGQAATITIDAGPAERTYQLSDFDNGLVDITTVDSLGNQLLVSGTVAPSEGCSRGFIAGLWKRVNNRGGIFSGRWMQVDGEPHGRMAGIWGLKANGDRAFYGVYVNAEGQLGGILRGTYEPVASSSNTDSSTLAGGKAGSFKGEWVSKSGEHKGKLRGAYVVGDPGQGHFQGGWAERGCEE